MQWLQVHELKAVCHSKTSGERIVTTFLEWSFKKLQDDNYWHEQMIEELSFPCVRKIRYTRVTRMMQTLNLAVVVCVVGENGEMVAGHFSEKR
jgi:hypothetical protein